MGTARSNGPSIVPEASTPPIGGREDSGPSGRKCVVAQGGRRSQTLPVPAGTDRPRLRWFWARIGRSGQAAAGASRSGAALEAGGRPRVQAAWPRQVRESSPSPGCCPGASGARVPARPPCTRPLTPSPCHPGSHSRAPVLQPLGHLPARPAVEGDLLRPRGSPAARLVPASVPEEAHVTHSQALWPQVHGWSTLWVPA